jgi:hypothetical protein
MPGIESSTSQPSFHLASTLSPLFEELLVLDEDGDGDEDEDELPEL